MSKRLEYIKRGKKVMEEMFIRPDFKLKEFNFDVFIDDMGYLIERAEKFEDLEKQNKRYREALESVHKKTNKFREEVFYETKKALEDK